MVVFILNERFARITHRRDHRLPGRHRQRKLAQKGQRRVHAHRHLHAHRQRNTGTDQGWRRATPHVGCRLAEAAILTDRRRLTGPQKDQADRGITHQRPQRIGPDQARATELIFKEQVALSRLINPVPIKDQQVVLARG